MKENRLPWAGLLALAMAGFITILTEALPAGLLPQMSTDLGVSEALIGQFVTMYALGSLVAAIPLTAYTRGMRRRPLLLAAIIGFLFVNTLTAISDNYVVTLVARFLAGVSAGLLWALLAGYASRMVPEQLRGRAIAVAMVGTPLALSLGIPAGTLLGQWVGWRFTFGIMSAITFILIFWVLWQVPDFEGQKEEKQESLLKTLQIPGLKSVLLVVLGFVLAHNILYTYISPFLVPSGLSQKIDVVLFLFGMSSLIGIFFTGAMIDRWLRELTLWSTLIFALTALSLAFWGEQSLVVYIAVIFWGLAFGGVPTLFQTACAMTSDESADVAQSMLVTAWNTAIAGGGLIGGVLLDRVGVTAFPWALFLLLIPTYFVIWNAKTHGFPSVRQKHI